MQDWWRGVLHCDCPPHGVRCVVEIVTDVVRHVVNSWKLVVDEVELDVWLLFAKRAWVLVTIFEPHHRSVRLERQPTFFCWLVHVGRNSNCG